MRWLPASWIQQSEGVQIAVLFHGTVTLWPGDNGPEPRNTGSIVDVNQDVTL